ncbi:MAG: hypothetical protein KGN84_10655 [Acidobacteriota bacterium]|nr:hypothetical protein [Acidobacteriota bacterium]
MATFPTLKTRAVAQYPLVWSANFQTESVRFLDGSRQQFRVRKSLRNWTLRLSLLDEQELASVISFCEQQGVAPFSFTDPISGAVAQNCILAGPVFDATATDELNSQTILRIEEIA